MITRGPALPLQNRLRGGAALFQAKMDQMLAGFRVLARAAITTVRSAPLKRYEHETISDRRCLR